MIICEECGTRNRNGSYVCAECGAGLLHLEETEDDFEPAKRAPKLGRNAQPVEDEIPVYEDAYGTEDEPDDDKDGFDEQAPVRPRRPLFGRKARSVQDEPQQYENDALESDEPQQYEEYEPEEETPVRPRRSLFGRKARSVQDEPEYEDDASEPDEPQQYEKYEPEEEAPARLTRPLFGKRGKQEETEPAGYEEDESEQMEEIRFVVEEPENDELLAGMTVSALIGNTQGDEPEDNGMTLNVEEEMASIEIAAPEEELEEVTVQPAEQNAAQEPEAEEPPRIADQEPIRVKPPKAWDSKQEEAPSSITIDLEMPEFGDVDDDYEDGDDGYEEEHGYREAPVYKADFKAAYNKSRRGESERMTRGMIAAIITVSSLLVVTLVVLGVLLIGKQSRTAPVIATTAPPVAATVEPTPGTTMESTPGPTEAPLSSPTLVPTTPPEEDFGSVFEQPTDGLLPDADN